MVLNDLGSSIRQALYNFNKTPAVDEKALDLLLKDICRALLESDVNVKLVQSLRSNIKELVNFEALPAGMNKNKVVQKAVFDSLCRLLDPGVETYTPKKGQSNIVMFVGLQGAGKTTTCTKYALYYQKKGYKVGLVCADTFRAGAFDQLKQNATRAKIPFYGSYSETDPVQIAYSGVEKFKKEQFELIIVDTSGRHKQESALFDEMQQISKVARPNQVIFIMDGSIGQAADAQAQAFKATVDIGSIILTKMDGHAKGGGALSAVAATKSPITFIGTGEHIHDLEKFSVSSFVNKLLGLGDIGGLIETVQDLKIDQATALDMQKRIFEQGQFSLRDMYEQFQMIMSLGPISKVMGMMPGFTSDMFRGSDADISLRFKRYMTIMDSMSNDELGSEAKCFSTQPNRLVRIARGSGSAQSQVQELLVQYKQFSMLIKKMGGNKGLFKNLANSLGGGGMGSEGGGPTNPAAMARMNQQMSKLMSPDFMKQMGGMGGLQNLMKQFQGGSGGTFK